MAGDEESRGIIRRLAPDVIAKIAAGEVVTRPSAVVKELIENSIDAGATQIKVSLYPNPLDGGMVTDNGCGVGPADLQVICQRFTTSKHHVDDSNDTRSKFPGIIGVKTYGFRGEALAALSQASHVTISSRRPCDEQRTVVKYLEGKPIDDQTTKADGPVGFTITFSKLFFSMETRLRALSSNPASEFVQCVDIVQKYALHHHNIKFILEKIGTSVNRLTTSGGIGNNANAANETAKENPGGDDMATTSGPTSQIRESPLITATTNNNDNDTIAMEQLIKVKRAIAEIYGNSLANSLFKFHSTRQHPQYSYTCLGLFTNPLSQARVHDFITFINNRLVQQKNLKLGIDSIYRDLLPKGQRRFVYISLQVPSAGVDANVHPSKQWVVFENQVEIINALCLDLKVALDKAQGAGIQKPAYKPSQTLSFAPAKRENEEKRNGGGGDDETAKTGDNASEDAAQTTTTTATSYVAPLNPGTSTNQVKVHPKDKVRKDYRQTEMTRYITPSISIPNISGSFLQDGTLDQDGKHRPQLSTLNDYSFMETVGDATMLADTWSSNLVSSLIRDMASAGDSIFAKPILCSILVGALDLKNVLLQYETQLMLVNVLKLAEECAYQSIIWRLGHIPRIEFDKPISVGQVLEFALTRFSSGNATKISNPVPTPILKKGCSDIDRFGFDEYALDSAGAENVASSNDKLAQLMSRFPVDLLLNFFSFDIATSTCPTHMEMHAMPQVLSRYFPGLDYLPELMFQIFTTPATDEATMIRHIARLLAKFYTTLPSKATRNEACEYLTRILLPAVQNFPDLVLDKRKLASTSMLYRIFERC